MTIAEFFLRLATDKRLQERWASDPEEVLRGEEGLAEHQRALLLSGDTHKLRVKIKAEFILEDGPESEIIAYHTIYTVPTIYVPPPPPPPEE
jgi:hypothetical protein